MRRFLTLLAFASALIHSSCRATLRPDFVKVVDLLGKPTGMDAGNCKSPDVVAGAYKAEVGGKEKAPLSEVLLPFAKKAAAICPESRPFIRTDGEVEIKKVTAMIGLPDFNGNGRLQLEPWLWFRIIDGKVIGVELELAKL